MRSSDSEVAVPTCPGWTALDLVRHVVQVYAHKAAVLRAGDPDLGVKGSQVRILSSRRLNWLVKAVSVKITALTVPVLCQIACAYQGHGVGFDRLLDDAQHGDPRGTGGARPFRVNEDDCLSRRSAPGCSRSS
jgi:hypothetical protein